jgi:hypothetical protein
MCQQRKDGCYYSGNEQDIYQGASKLVQETPERASLLIFQFVIAKLYEPIFSFNGAKSSAVRLKVFKDLRLCLLVPLIASGQ